MRSLSAFFVSVFGRKGRVGASGGESLPFSRTVDQPGVAHPPAWSLAATPGDTAVANSIPLALAHIDMQLSDIEAILDSLLFMHEAASPGDRERLFVCTIPLLYAAREKAAEAHQNSNKLHRREFRRKAA